MSSTSDSNGSFRTNSTLQKSFFGYPAAFGAPINATASLPATLVWATPLSACTPVSRPLAQGAVGLVSRGNCSFADKARSLQDAGFSAMVLVDGASTDGACVLAWANSSDAAGIAIPLAIITKNAGTTLVGLLSGDAHASASLRQPEQPRVDWGATALWLLATATVATAAALARCEQAAALVLSDAGSSEKEGAARGETEGRLQITAAGAVWFVVISSALLLFLFFFLSKWLALTMVWLFALGAWTSLAALLHEAMVHAAPQCWRKAHTPPLPLRIGALPVLSTAASVASGAAALTWALCRHASWAWLLQDVLAVALMLVLLRQLLLPNLKVHASGRREKGAAGRPRLSSKPSCTPATCPPPQVACVLLPLAFAYDVWWVFIEPLVFGGRSVMVEVATGGLAHQQLPMVLRVPHWSDLPLDNPAYSILGFGDVCLPGLLTVLAARWDAATSAAWLSGLALPSVAGYGAGLGLTYAALIFGWFGDEGQPALLYLVPCTLGTVALLAWRRGQLGRLWLVDLDSTDGGGSGSAAGSSTRPVNSLSSLAMEAGEAEEYGLLASPTVGRGSLAMPSPF